MPDVTGDVIGWFRPPPIVTAAPPTPGLVPCAVCGTPQRPGAVHFAKPTDDRPCAGSWPARPPAKKAVRA